MGGEDTGGILAIASRVFFKYRKGMIHSQFGCKSVDIVQTEFKSAAPMENFQ